MLVEFRNLHYECQYGKILKASGLDGQEFSGVRTFQADLFVKNLGTTPVEPPWKPSRWVVTNGTEEHDLTYMWEWWVGSEDCCTQAPIPPGVVSGWTFLAYPLQEGEWVKAAEFEWNGVTYRQEFDLGEFGDAFNYVPCVR